MQKLTKMEWFVAILTLFVLLLAFAWLITVSTDVAFAASEPVELEGRLTVAGSTALLPLMEVGTGEFIKLHPKVEISLEGGGSGKGRADVCAGSVDIRNSDVPLSEAELADPMCASAVQTLVALQVFAFAANPQGPGGVTDLTQAQLQGIFRGEINNWQEVGGEDMAEMGSTDQVFHAPKLPETEQYLAGRFG